jgi:hypothetical protein
MLGKKAPQSLALGQLGSTFINDTNAHTGLSVGRIYCISACGFTTLTSGFGANGAVVMAGTLSALTLAAGMEIQGLFTVITLSSGSVIAYNV